MKKDQVVILEKRGAVLISGNDADYFLQNIITNDIKKVSNKNSIFAALLTPQGKYLNDFFIVKNHKGYMLDCNENSTEELIKNLSKYKLRSDVKIEDLSSEFVIGVINHEKFIDLQKEVKSDLNTIYYRNTPIFSDPRNKKLGARIFSNLEKLYFLPNPHKLNSHRKSIVPKNLNPLKWCDYILLSKLGRVLLGRLNHQQQIQ